MNTKNIALSLVLGLAMVNGSFASTLKSDTKEMELDLNSITYIEEEVEIDLGFDPAEYLPEGFDPYKMYVDFDAIPYIEEEVDFKLNSKKYLPLGFDAYAFPANVEGFNYIDESDFIELDFDATEHLPEGFDPYIKKMN